MSESKEVTQRPILPGTISGGIKTETAEEKLSIMLGMNVCKKWFSSGLLNIKSIKNMVQLTEKRNELMKITFELKLHHLLTRVE